MLLSAADIPLSLIGDLVMWPYTAIFTYINRPTYDDLAAYPAVGASSYPAAGTLQTEQTPVAPTPVPLSMPKINPPAPPK